MDNSPEFFSYKKLLIFGSQGSGKSSIVKMLKKGSSGNDQPDSGNLIFI